MARRARGEVIDPSQVQVLHCVQRCVRRAFLCGVDPYSGMSYEHRREWIRERLEYLASILAIDCLTYTVLSNGNYVVNSPNWDNGPLVNAGAATFGNATTGVIGSITSVNSAIGTTANTSLQTVVVDNPNDAFFGRFLAEADPGDHSRNVGGRWRRHRFADADGHRRRHQRGPGHPGLPG